MRTVATYPSRGCGLHRRACSPCSRSLLAGCSGTTAPSPTRIDGRHADDLLEPAAARRLRGGGARGRGGPAARAGRRRTARRPLPGAARGARQHASRTSADWDPDEVERNAHARRGRRHRDRLPRRARLGGSAVSLPITNEEGILQVSPLDGLTSLTAARREPAGGPERYYPTERRTFLRLVPHDLRMADAAARPARERGARGVAVVYDEGIYGRELAGAARAGRARGPRPRGERARRGPRRPRGGRARLAREPRGGAARRGRLHRHRPARPSAALLAALRRELPDACRCWRRRRARRGGRPPERRPTASPGLQPVRPARATTRRRAGGCSAARDRASARPARRSTATSPMRVVLERSRAGPAPIAAR